MEHDTKRIRSGFQQRLRGNPPVAEHVVGVKNLLLIKKDIRKCIQAIKNQVSMIVRERGCINLKRGLILPVGQADPLQTELVVAIERIGDEAAVQQIGLNHARNLRGMPFFDVGSICVCHGAKLPARIQVSR